MSNTHDDMKIAATLLLAACALTGCGSGNLDYIKDHSTERWREQGFEPIGYEGYEWRAVVPFTNYGGACVWYRVRNIKDNGITYDGCLSRWGDEIHLYDLHSMDAIKP